MRKLLIVAMLVFPLTACAGTSVLRGGTDIFASTTNPVTPQMLYDVENGLTIAVTGMLTYKKLCINKQIDQSCRGVVVKLQGYVHKARPILTNLRKFVRQNDQVNAITAFNAIRGLLVDFQATAAAAGAK